MKKIFTFKDQTGGYGDLTIFQADKGFVIRSSEAEDLECRSLSEAMTQLTNLLQEDCEAGVFSDVERFLDGEE
jgi:hypothetical protein